ncbi:MAG: class I SAM-dependent methyltransferase [Actinomycetota bacterium]
MSGDAKVGAAGVLEDEGSRPGDRWRAGIEAAALPEELRRKSSDARVGLTPDRFRFRPEEDATKPVRPSRRRALEALPEGGTVLDVGCGAGASSLGLAAKAGLIIGFDRIEAMLEAFAETAAELGVEVRAVLGTWPEVATEAGTADVVVCHHAMYGVAEVEDFVMALTAAARHRVVLELSEHPPQSGLEPLWKAIHGIDRPRRLVADEAQAVLSALGLAVEREDFVVPPQPTEVTEEVVAIVRGRLMVGPERDAEIADLLRARVPSEHRVAALWWPGAALA